MVVEKVEVEKETWDYSTDGSDLLGFYLGKGKSLLKLKQDYLYEKKVNKETVSTHSHIIWTYFSDFSV